MNVGSQDVAWQGNPPGVAGIKIEALSLGESPRGRASPEERRSEANPGKCALAKHVRFTHLPGGRGATSLWTIRVISELPSLAT